MQSKELHKSPTQRKQPQMRTLGLGACWATARVMQRRRRMNWYRGAGVIMRAGGCGFGFGNIDSSEAKAQSGKAVAH